MITQTIQTKLNQSYLSYTEDYQYYIMSTFGYSAMPEGYYYQIIEDEWYIVENLSYHD